MCYGFSNARNLALYMLFISKLKLEFEVLADSLSTNFQQWSMTGYESYEVQYFVQVDFEILHVRRKTCILDMFL